MSSDVCRSSCGCVNKRGETAKSQNQTQKKKRTSPETPPRVSSSSSRLQKATSPPPETAVRKIVSRLAVVLPARGKRSGELSGDADRVL